MTTWTDEEAHQDRKNRRTADCISPTGRHAPKPRLLSRITTISITGHAGCKFWV